MMKSPLLLFLIFFCFAVSCTPKNDNNGKIVINLAENLSLTDVNPDFLLNEIFDSISFVQLEQDTINNYVRPRLKDITKDGDYCFIDYGSNNTIRIYDKEGNIITSLNKTGKGEGEYILPMSVIYTNDEVMVYGYTEQFLFRYTKDGFLKSKTKMPSIIDMCLLDDGTFLCKADLIRDSTCRNLLYIVDSLGNIRNQFLPVEENKRDMNLSESPVLRANGQCHFAIQTINRSVYYDYNPKNNDFTEQCEFDFGGHGIDENMMNGTSVKDMKEYIFEFSPVQVGDYLFGDFFHNNHLFYSIWSLKSGKLIVRRVVDIQNPSASNKFSYKMPDGELIDFSFRDIYSSENEFITTETPTQLADKNIKNIDSEGDIVLVKMKLKK